MRSVIIAALLPALSGAHLAAQAHWIYLDSAETGTPPVLALTLRDGTTKELPVAADTVLIEYLPEGAWAHLPTLSIDEQDKNRPLLRFAVPRGLDIARAELRASAHPSKLAPRGDTRFVIHAVNEDWGPGTTWATAPAFDPAVAATAEVPFGGGEIAVELTALARRWSAEPDSDFGILLRRLTDHGEPRISEAEALARTDPAAGLTARLRRHVGFRESLAAARAAARESKKLVLALVVADVYEPAGSTHERALCVHALLDRRVRALVDADFVPVRISTSPNLHLGPNPSADDPLRDLGTDCVTAKAPALVIATPSGELRGVLASIGTFDAALVGGFLHHALAAKGSFAAAAPAEGVERWRSGDEVGARERWQRIATDATAAPAARLRAEAWLLWPDLLDATAPRTAVQHDPDCPTTERPQLATAGAEAKLVARAVDELLLRQRADGRWVHPDQDLWDAAVTALCARALDRQARWLDRDRGARAAKAIDRAEAWLADWIARVEPAVADSFGTAYVVDLFAARLVRSARAKAGAADAVALLLQGQLPNGAWSYNLQFGTGWRGGFGGWPATDKGRAHSINTGVALAALVRARAAGLEVPPADIARGVAALEAMKRSPTTFTYTWPDPSSFDGPDQSIGKAPVCLEALVGAGARPAADLEAALAEFMQWRSNLRATVKLTPGWVGPSGTSSYFFFQAYVHAAEAIAAAGGARAKERLELLRRDILQVAEVDGTWVDYENNGKSYGTAMALSVLAIARAARE